MDARQTEHSLEALIKQQEMGGVVFAYEDLNDHDSLIAISFRDAFRNHDHILTPDKVGLRINLGPVKIVKFQGERRVIADVINVSQRIMEFAKLNQLFVSRSFYEFVGCISENYSTMFNYLGIRAGKHVRQHAVYEIVFEGEARSEMPALQVARNQVSTAPAAAWPRAPFDEVQLNQIAYQLADYIGSLALILVKKAAKKARNLDYLYYMLAKDALSTKEQKRQFLDFRHTIF